MSRPSGWRSWDWEFRASVLVSIALVAYGFEGVVTQHTNVLFIAFPMSGMDAVYTGIFYIVLGALMVPLELLYRKWLKGRLQLTEHSDIMELERKIVKVRHELRIWIFVPLLAIGMIFLNLRLLSLFSEFEQTDQELREAIERLESERP